MSRGGLLVGALRGRDDVVARLAVVEEDLLVETVVAARYHRVGGYLAKVLPAGASGAAVDHLRADVASATAQHMRTLADHRSVAGVLSQVGVQHLVVKGPVLAEHHHGGPDLRSYRDLDLLVAGADLERAMDALTEAGLASVDRNWDLMTEAVAGEVHLVGRFGTPVDLHWQLLFRQSVRREFALDLPGMLARARDVQLGGTTMRTLDPVDTLLHLCLHAAQSGGHRLVWLKDVERCIAVDQPDWDEVVSRARNTRLHLVVGLLLGRSAQVLGAQVPRPVLRALAGPGFRAVVATVDRFTPAPRSTSRGSAARMVSKAVRGDLTSTATSLSRTVGGLRPSAVRVARHPTARGDQGADLMIESGGPRGRSRYLAAVAAEVAAPTPHTPVRR